MKKNINLIKNIFYILLSYLLTINIAIADGGILGEFKGTDTQKTLRDGSIHLDDIPIIIKKSIDFFITIAGTIAIIFIIIGAYKILLGSLEQDRTKGKDTIIMALGGFALASLAWFIVKLIIDNLS